MQMTAAAVFLVTDGIAATTMVRSRRNLLPPLTMQGVMRGLGRAPTSALSMAMTNWLFVRATASPRQPL